MFKKIVHSTYNFVLNNDWFFIAVSSFGIGSTSICAFYEYASHDYFNMAVWLFSLTIWLVTLISRVFLYGQKKELKAYDESAQHFINIINEALEEVEKEVKKKESKQIQPKRGPGRPRKVQL